MKKILLIIQREYLSRVKKKSFLITTFLIPLAMLGITIGLAVMAAKSEQRQKILVWDESGVFLNKLDSNSASYKMVYTSQPQGDYKAMLEKEEADILLHIYPFVNGQPDSINLYKQGGLSLNAKDFISDELNAVYQVKLLQDAGMNKSKIDSINESQISPKSFDLDNNQETHTEISTMIGYATGFLIYLVILIYGMGVMRGVTEEKTSRIAEVIVSSVKPFQLMMGKIVGIALVGLTQFTLWLLLTGLLQLVLPLFVPGVSSTHVLSDPSMQKAQSESLQQLSPFLHLLYAQNWVLIISCFLFYFLGGYFIYAALFAAVGSLVNEDPQEVQQMTFPVTLPIIVAFFIMMTATRDPNSSLAIFGSMFPLTSPIVMMARIPYGIPAWQIILSMLLLVIGFLAMTWIGAKIYRTGILMYGKKPSWKEVFRWLRYH